MMKRYAEIALLDDEYARFMWWAVEVNEAPRIAEPRPGLEAYGAVYKLRYLEHGEAVTELDGVFTHTPRWRWLSRRPAETSRPATEAEATSFLDKYSEATFAQLCSRAGKPEACWHSGYVLQSLDAHTLCVEWNDGWVDAVPVSATKDAATWRWGTYLHEGTLDGHKHGQPLAAFIEPPSLRYGKFEWPGIVTDTATAFAGESLGSSLLIPLIESPVRGMSVPCESAGRRGDYNCVLLHLPKGSVPQPRYFAHQSHQDDTLAYLATIKPVRNGERLVVGEDDAARQALLEHVLAHGAQFPEPWLPPKTFRRLVAETAAEEESAKPKPKTKPKSSGSKMDVLDGLRENYRRAFIEEMVKLGRMKMLRQSKTGLPTIVFDDRQDAFSVIVPASELDNSTLLLDSALRGNVCAAKAEVKYHGANVRRRSGSSNADKLQTNITPLLTVAFADGKSFKLNCNATWEKAK